jgi:hypothetical protein
LFFFKIFFGNISDGIWVSFLTQGVVTYKGMVRLELKIFGTSHYQSIAGTKNGPVQSFTCCGPI